MSLHSFFLRTISQTIFQGNSFGGEEARLAGKKLVWRGRSSCGGEEVRVAGTLVWRGSWCGGETSVAGKLVWLGNWCGIVWLGNSFGQGTRMAGELVWPGNSLGRGTRLAGELQYSIFELI